MENERLNIEGRGGELSALGVMISAAESLLPYSPDYGFVEAIVNLLEYWCAAGSACDSDGNDLETPLAESLC